MRKSLETTSGNTFRTSFCRLFVFSAFALLCCSGAFAQQRQLDQEIAAAYPLKTIAATESQMSLLFWILGSRQGRPSADEVQDTTSQKKQLIISGMAPNRILTRAFLNKAINYESTLT
jgi:hypothetical protein